MTRAIQPRHLLLFLFVINVWSFNFVVAKWGLAELPPIFFMALRFVIVALVLVPFVPRPHGHWGKLALIALSLGGLHFSTMWVSLLYVPASTVSIIVQLQTPFAALLAAVFLDDRLGWRRWLGMVLAFAGVAVVVGGPTGGAPAWAISLAVVAAFLWAAANVQIKLLHGAVSGSTLNAWIAVMAVPQLLIASAVLERGQIEALESVTWVGIGALLYNALIVVVLTYGIWYRLLKRYDVNQSMPFTLLVAPFSVLYAALLLDEPLTWSMLIGGVTTVVGVGIIVLRRPRLAAPETERA